MSDKETSQNGSFLLKGKNDKENDTEDEISLKEPEISDHSVEWECIYFGSYPQDEISEGDEDYHLLLESEEWADDILTIEGDTFCRMQKKDALYYNKEYWSGNEKYRYFKYQPIKWRVLTAESGEITLMSDIALDTKMFNRNNHSSNWGDSDIRSWLNYDFVNRAFSESEQKDIISKVIDNKKNPIYQTSSGETTEDKVVLLSYDEIEEKSYGMSGSVLGTEAKKCTPSSYAKARGVYVDGGYCSWWLRTSGNEPTTAVRIFSSGEIASDGSDLWYDRHGVRPVITLSTDSKNLEYAGTVEVRQ